MDPATVSTAANYSSRASSFASWAVEQGTSASVARTRLKEAANRVGLRCSSLLDIGCGSGRDLEQFQKEIPELTRVVGVDPCQDLIKIASENATPSCTLHYGEIQSHPRTWDPPLEEGLKFDLVYSLASLFHVPKESLGRVFENIKTRLLKDGGLLLTSFPDRDSNVEMSDGRWCTGFEPGDHQKLLRSAGFEPIDNFQIRIYNGKWDVVISKLRPQGT